MKGMGMRKFNGLFVAAAIGAAAFLPGCVVTPELLSSLLSGAGRDVPGPSADLEVKDYFFPYTATWKLEHKTTSKTSFTINGETREDSITGTTTEEIDSFGGLEARTKTTSNTTVTTKAGSGTSTQSSTSTSRSDYTLNADGSVTSHTDGSNEKFTVTKGVFGAGGASYKQNDVLFKLTPQGRESIVAGGKEWETFKFKVEASSATTSAVAGGEFSMVLTMSGNVWLARKVGSVKLNLAGNVAITGIATGSGTTSMAQEIESATP